MGEGVAIHFIVIDGELNDIRMSTLVRHRFVVAAESSREW